MEALEYFFFLGVTEAQNIIRALIINHHGDVLIDDSKRRWEDARV